jgi:hypothetical protein
VCNIVSEGVIVSLIDPESLQSCIACTCTARCYYMNV